MKTLTAPVASPEEGLSAEQKRLLAHRTLGLLDLGFTLPQTVALAKRNDVVHEAQALLARGCPHEFVVEELIE